ncbi:DUF2935 domain-containing protein [Paenibacillus sp. LHD-117]|uniref:DUF2935 domain-containing protein n=1 Tax=Paenibacillus sp. LHD-117 TaxID=3071412 RepID=UPI0027DFC4C7|nr:DUF2935 domain-containing protein [Paenibacillus sp. LHD-117]MDQ6422441.1 DUF2935 domain-containing protein [Paenibacillus sp. LHD-117]
MNLVRSITVWEEHAFWLEILQDHAYFVYDYTAPYEKAWVSEAEQFIARFEELRRRLDATPRNEPHDSAVMIQLAREIWPVAEGYYQFEGRLQNLRIDNKIQVALSPTFFNGTLNENQEYLRQLAFYMEGKLPERLPLVQLLDLWMEDQLGHAVLLRSALDPMELEVIRETDRYSEIFQGFMVQNHQIKGYLRFSPPGMKRQQLLARQVGQAVLGMNAFVYRVVLLYRNTELMNKTTLRFLEHHFPETCYFIRKLSEYAPELQEAASKCSLKKPSFR